MRVKKGGRNTKRKIKVETIDKYMRRYIKETNEAKKK